MGCDIHLFVEYRQKENGARWQSFGKEFHLDRDYSMFGRMARVRRETEVGFAPRGLPVDVAYAVEHVNLCYIHDGEKEEDNYVTSAKAAEWVQSGCSKYVDRYNNGKNTYVTHPDWHSHSWLTLEEFEQCIECSKYKVSDYRAVATAMRSLESDGYQTRVVFFFDN